MYEEKQTRVDKYCGTVSKPIGANVQPKGRIEDGKNNKTYRVRADREKKETVNKEDEGDSVLQGINLDSDDDFTDEDEDAE